MKILIPVIFVLIELSCFSQDFNYFNLENKFNWSPYEHVSAEILKSNFKLLKEKPYPELKHLLDNQDKFHLVDIDNDQVNEVIYNGWNGGEGEMVVLFKLTDNRGNVKFTSIRYHVRNVCFDIQINISIHRSCNISCNNLNIHFSFNSFNSI